MTQDTATNEGRAKLLVNDWLSVDVNDVIGLTNLITQALDEAEKRGRIAGIKKAAVMASKLEGDSVVANDVLQALLTHANRLERGDDE